jgi:hypothetical protein
LKYQSGAAFRRALEDRLRTIQAKEGSSLDRLRKMVAFDRYLARLIEVYPDQWTLKGGLALQLRMKEYARTTKDIDLSIADPHVVVYPILKKAGSLDLGDWFMFLVEKPEERSIGVLGGLRHHIQAIVDGREFESFHIDIGVGDPITEPADYLFTSPLLGFAGLAPTRVPCFPVMQQIAEKLHAYTRPRSSGEPSRVKDLVDLFLLAKLGNITGEGLNRAVQSTFEHANTHPIPGSIPPPPQDWDLTYKKLISEVGAKDISLWQTYSKLQQFLDPVLGGNFMNLDWDNDDWSWKLTKE